MKRLGQTLADQHGLACVFEDNRIARNEGGGKSIDGGEIGVVPRGHDEDHADRFAGEVTGELIVVFNHLGGKCGLGDIRHVIGAVVHAAEFPAITGGATHLVRQFFDQNIFHFHQLGHACFDKVNALGQRALGPSFLSGFGAGDDGLGCVLGERHPFGVDRAVGGRDELDWFHGVVLVGCVLVRTDL